jgi:peptidoglycan-N-acetylglucosamine deacetylase
VLCILLSGCTVLHPNQWPKNSGKIILTFDDGPSEDNGSARLLDVLKREDVKATFCYIGRNVIRNPSIVKRAYDEGHIIANHTYVHRRPLFSFSQFDSEILKTDTAIGSAISKSDYHASIFRPPYGLITPAVFLSREASRRDIAYLTFFIDDTSADSATSQKVMNRLKKALLANRGGAIALHEMRYPPTSKSPSKDWLPGAVDDLIRWARAHGMTFTTYKSAEQDAAANP